MIILGVSRWLPNQLHLIQDWAISAPSAGQQRGRDEIASPPPGKPPKRCRHFPADANLRDWIIDPNEDIFPRKVISCPEGGMQRYIRTIINVLLVIVSALGIRRILPAEQNPDGTVARPLVFKPLLAVLVADVLEMMHTKTISLDALAI